MFLVEWEEIITGYYALKRCEWSNETFMFHLRLLFSLCFNSSMFLFSVCSFLFYWFLSSWIILISCSFFPDTGFLIEFLLVLVFNVWFLLIFLKFLIKNDWTLGLPDVLLWVPVKVLFFDIFWYIAPTIQSIFLYEKID